MNRGFSLVELSIVLVILGLLTGGILAGQSLIRASELRAVSTEYQRYVTATKAFRDKYFEMPGDFRNATRFWARSNTNADCVSNHGLASAGTPGTCDGDGAGTLSGAGAATESDERFQFWRHLALAGLIEGTYSGFGGTGTYGHVVGTNAPGSKLNNSGWAAQSLSAIYGATTVYRMHYGNFLIFGQPISGTFPQDPNLKPEEAWNIDTKMDDGRPAYGSIIARFWNDLCARPDDGATFTNTNHAASYKLSDNTLQCSLYFRHAF